MAGTQPNKIYAQLKGPGEPQVLAVATRATLGSFFAQLNSEESFNSISLLWQ
jgi:hypothetical protein